MQIETVSQTATATSPEERGTNNTTTNTPRGALKLREAARYLGVSLITVRRLIDRGFLYPNRTCRHLLFPIAELDRYLLDPRNTARHTKLPPQNLTGSQHWRKAVATSSRNKKRAAPTFAK